jgi:hypothetical protein
MIRGDELRFLENFLMNPSMNPSFVHENIEKINLLILLSENKPLQQNLSRQKRIIHVVLKLPNRHTNTIPTTRKSD